MKKVLVLGFFLMITGMLFAFSIVGRWEATLLGSIESQPFKTLSTFIFEFKEDGTFLMESMDGKIYQKNNYSYDEELQLFCHITRGILCKSHVRFNADGTMFVAYGIYGEEVYLQFVYIKIDREEK